MLLGAAVVLVFAQMVMLTAAQTGGLANVPVRVMDKAFTSYHTISRQVDDVGEFLERYPNIQRDFPAHGKSQPPGRVLFFHAINEWAAGWEKRGWRRKAGPVANLELVKELYALAKAHPRTRLQWIRAHDGSRWNEYVDAVASTYLREAG